MMGYSFLKSTGNSVLYPIQDLLTDTDMLTYNTWITVWITYFEQLLPEPIRLKDSVSY